MEKFQSYHWRFSCSTLTYFHVWIIELYAVRTVLPLQVVIYSKSYCPYCSATKSLFQTQFSDVDAKIFELDQMNDGASIQSDLAAMTGQRTVPNVWVRGKFVGGNDDTQALFRSGKLTEMLSSKL